MTCRENSLRRRATPLAAAGELLLGVSGVLFRKVLWGHGGGQACLLERGRKELAA